MKRAVLCALAATLAVSAWAQQKKKTAAPANTRKPVTPEHSILRHTEGARKANPATQDMLVMNLRMSTEKKDSVMLDTYAENQPRYIPSTETVLGPVLSLLSKGDSAVFWINADSLFRKSFGSEKPKGMAAGERVKFVVSVIDVLSQQELLKKQADYISDIKRQDSSAMMAYVSTLTGVKQTASGLMYVVTKATTGRQAKSGDKVSMRYTGYLLNGEVFDGNMEKNGPPFDFTIGAGQVIQGWDEGVALMKEGEEYKLIIPWNMAYGEGGTGPIKPFSTLVFDVKLEKIN
jgi:FKBP-type peptidyl-prolyl cis-trans isomerase FkpA